MDTPDGFNGCQPASAELIAECEASLGLKLPKDYVDFLREHNGGEGFIGQESYLILWPIEQIKKFNADYEVADYCPGLLLFGSSGGGEAYGFDTRANNWGVARVPFVGMDFSLLELMGVSFTAFVEKLARDQG